MYGISLCASCEHEKPFKKANTEPAYLRIQATKWQQNLKQAGGYAESNVEILDEEQKHRATITVPDAILDRPGAVKQALTACPGPEYRHCGVGLMIEQMLAQPDHQPAVG